MKAIRFFLLTCILIPQIALASQQQNLKHILNEYAYAMTVEWDQKDMEFAREQETLFLNTVRELIKQGLTKEQIKEVFQRENPRINFSQLETELMLIDTSSPEALSKFISNKMKQNSHSGANWLGDVPYEVWGLLTGIIFMAVVITILNKDSDAAPSSGASGPACVEYRYNVYHHCEPRYDYYNNGAYYEFCYDVTDRYCERYAVE